MSWDVAFVRIRGSCRPVAEVAEADYIPLGKPAAVRKAIRAAFPKAEWLHMDGLVYAGKGLEIEFDLEGLESANTVVAHVHGSGDPIRSLLQLASLNGWLVLDCSTGEFIDPQNPSYEGWEGFTALAANIDETQLKEQVDAPKIEPWPLLGVNRGPNDRYVYLQFLTGESPGKLQKKVFWKWRELTESYGKQAAISGPFFVLILPDGTAFGDFWIRWYPASVTETWEQFTPRVQEIADHLRAFATATNRRCGEIEDGSVFVCDDGQRIQLAQCTYRQLQTDADYARKVKLKSRG